MKTFHLQYRATRSGEDCSLDFHADDPHRVFGILEKLDGGCSARLWEGTRSLGAIRRDERELWEIGR
jgi:hypothetical protein